MATTTGAATTCRQLVELLGEYVAGGVVDDATRARCEAHLSECATCVAYLRSYRETIRLAKDAGGDDAATPVGMPAELVEAIVAAIAARGR
jgi:hypothetical protein